MDKPISLHGMTYIYNINQTSKCVVIMFTFGFKDEYSI